MLHDEIGGAYYQPVLPEASIDGWITDNAVWLPCDSEIKQDWFAASREDLNEAERRALRLWLQDKAADPEMLATVSIKLANCCRARAERRRALILERIRGKPGLARLLDSLENGRLSALAAGVVDHALDDLTPEETRVLGDARPETGTRYLSRFEACQRRVSSSSERPASSGLRFIASSRLSRASSALRRGTALHGLCAVLPQWPALVPGTRSPR